MRTWAVTILSQASFLCCYALCLSLKSNKEKITPKDSGERQRKQKQNELELEKQRERE